MDTLLDFVTNPDLIATAFLFIAVMADCLRKTNPMDYNTRC